MIEFDVGGNHYRTNGSLDAFEQDRIVRRLTPVVAKLARPFYDAIAASETGKKLEDADQRAALMKQFTGKLFTDLEVGAAALAGMADADCELIYRTCLRMVQIQRTGGAWANVQSSQGLLMFKEIGLLELYMITWKVVEENVYGFFSSIAQLLPDQEEGTDSSE